MLEDGDHSAVLWCGFVCVLGFCVSMLFIMNLKTAVEGARGFYILRRGAETRRFMGVIRQLNALMLFTHKVKICKAVLFRSK